ncbi:hypothetical protein CI109_106059 [Kwoniella shandongensis]|uniref:Uncharacterized protein n=1 Tax=Kwoniella shandongensis TaxID=1734106 RepID=A0A5M6BXP4_9TREE|nr:uncharacterized protein CI109_003886 [Kwoniella shandongensis]KAA5527627.1 hypothetical protein CI109_003886 [Kwoniella shandongensis]
MPSGSSGIPFPSSSPPLLPVPRQPSPLSFSSVGIDDPPSPQTPASSLLVAGGDGASSLSSASSSRIRQTSRAAALPVSTSPSPSPSPPTAARADFLVPTQPLPDSLLLKSTLSALEHSAVTLKRLSKSVLNAASAVHALAEQLEKAEDDLFVSLGDLGRWLESGYGVQNKYQAGIWDTETGIRKVNREKRRRERETMEVWVENGVKAVKSELKRQGLAGGGAHARYESTAKQFYHQTSVYLSPQTASTAGPSAAGSSSHTQQSSGNSVASSSASVGQPGPSDIAHALRHAQWDLVRYNHHSTLLYAVPPSSVGCLDLLVGFYGWVGGLLGETPGRKEGTEEGGRHRAATTGERLAISEMPVQFLSRQNEKSPSSETETLKESLSSSLSQLAKTRSDLLHAWAKRNHQTTLLEDETARRQQELEASWSEDPLSPKQGYAGGNAMIPVSSEGPDYKKAKKHKIHRSVGGRLREFLTPSTSSHALASQANSGERLSRVSLDGGYTRGEFSQPAPIRRRTDDGSTTPTQLGAEKLPTHRELPTSRDRPSSMYTNSAPAEMSTPPLPPPRQTSLVSPRPSLPSRHSVQMPNGVDYISPFIASGGDYVVSSPVTHSPDLTVPVEKEHSRHSIDVARVGVGRPVMGIGGVGGLGAGGDEDERREEAGRKKEGVLWGMGSWEGLSKSGSGKGKWEKYWVVLDHSRIYEYRDSAIGLPEQAHAVIDLKFASVREGRGTDRRFVFEIVTPSQGRRLYQATSEHEMKLWLYAICNAIESCINGTSSVRTFDASKLRTVSGSLDDHALPTRSKLGLGFNGRIIGLGLPMPPGGRRSMPPTPTSAHSSDTGEKRTRKTSLKKVLKQSGERLSNAVTGGGSGSGGDRSHRNSFGAGLDIPRPSFIKGGSSRSSLPLSTPEMETIPNSDATSISTSTATPPAQTSGRPSWVDGEIEKRVLEMAGLGLGLGPSSPSGAGGDSPGSAKRRVKSEAVRRTSNQPDDELQHPGGQMLTRSRSDDKPHASEIAGPGLEQGAATLDLAELRRITELEGNRKCADCGKNMKASRWATISLRDQPMVLFICIRCCGIHRSLGTHVSKPRSVDLDIWSPEMIMIASEWGNERGNGVWEWARGGGQAERPGDDQIGDFIKAKYVEGRWLSEDDRFKFGLSTAGVGKAM